MTANMNDEFAAIDEGGVTFLALVRPLARVPPHMIHQSAPLPERRLTMRTRKRPLIGMHYKVFG